MSARTILISTLLLLLCTTPLIASTEEEITIYQALEIAEDLEMTHFTKAERIFDFWAVKGLNPHNTKPSELLINAHTGLIESANNVTPRAIILGDTTYEFSGTIYSPNKDFYSRGQIYKGFEIYRNDSRYFKIKQAIFIRNVEGFVAYFMTQGPGMTK